MGYRDSTMTFVTINTEVETWVTRERDPEDVWDQGDTDGRVSNVTAWISERTEESHWYKSDSITKRFPDEVVAGTTLYAVVADYSSGCTFGRDGGHAQVLDAFTSTQEAEALRDVALVTNTESDRWRKEYDYSFTYGDREYYRSWAGYFESL